MTALLNKELTGPPNVNTDNDKFVKPNNKCLSYGMYFVNNKHISGH